LVTQQSEINRLQASEKNLALENREKEFIKKQSELELLQKEKQLQSALAAKQAQQKNLLFVISAVILLLGGYGWLRSRQNKKLSNRLSQSLKDLKDAQHQIIKAEKEKEAENIRLRISRDIHDEVGATLSGVALFSEIAKQKMEDHQVEDAGEYLQHISDSSKEMVEKMSDIVWTINPKNDSFDHIITKLKSYAVNLCASKGIKLHLNIDETVGEYYPDMQVRKHIYLLIKEAINNAVKYSGGKNIFFYIQKNNGCILVTIKDDGKGFDKSLIVAGNGLSNMQSRAMELDARLTIDSANEAGTTITLLLNIHPIGVHRHGE
jgi:signal transduction histidine kinase